jgi:flagellar hook protein FlgE
MGIENIANTGMQSAMSDMEVISNNISNANTIGFKKSHINFSDLFPSGTGSAGVQIGLGVRVVGVQQDFNSGGIEETDRGSDLSIGNDGFFIVKDPITGLTSYTRDGSFNLDGQGYLKFGNERVQGFPSVNGAILAPSLVDLQISNTAMTAKQSATVTGSLNLDSGSVPPTTTFNSADPTTYNFASNTTIYDSLGNSYQLSMYYIKTADNTWTVQAQVGGNSVGSGTMTFGTNGQLTATTGLDALSFVPGSGATTPQPINVNLAGATQFGNPSATQPFTQDGYQAGTLSSYSIDNNGLLSMQYTNGQSQQAGQIALARFASPEGLTNIGNMSWTASANSGSPMIGLANSQGEINPNSLELSNVDLTEEMVNLITAQHSFQANAQVEQVYNEVMQTVIKL